VESIGADWARLVLTHCWGSEKSHGTHTEDDVVLVVVAGVTAGWAWGVSGVGGGLWFLFSG
jgi:hypothetical protein